MEAYLDPKQNWGSEPWREPRHQDGETVLYSECGRILDCDYRSHWFKMVKPKYGPVTLLVSHGGGNERISMGHVTGKHIASVLSVLDSNQRYLMMYAAFSLYRDGEGMGEKATAERYKRAFVDDRLRKRKTRGQLQVKVWIEPEVAKTTAEPAL